METMPLSENNYKYDITGCIVVYENSLSVVNRAIKSFLSVKELRRKLLIVDNSPSEELKTLCNKDGLEYIPMSKNIGFGRGHNVAIKRILDESEYHLILNPDIYFASDSLMTVYNHMESHLDIGMIMPKLLAPDGSLSYTCRQLPTPLILIIRRFLPILLKSLFRKKLERYELRHKSYNEILEIPYLSGACLFVRTEVFKTVGMFDDRFFLYMEDVDFSRRVSEHYRTIFLPDAEVYHLHTRGSYNSWPLLKHHIISAIKYFNKWGWQPWF